MTAGADFLERHAVQLSLFLTYSNRDGTSIENVFCLLTEWAGVFLALVDIGVFPALDRQAFSLLQIERSVNTAPAFQWHVESIRRAPSSPGINSCTASEAMLRQVE